MTKIDTSTEAVERLLENVTPGPWQAETCEDYITEYGFERLLITSETGISVVEGCGCCGSPFGENVKDTHFIRAARDLVPALLKERDEARAKLDAAVDALREASQTLAWQCFGECRGFSENLLTPKGSLDQARATLAKIKGAGHE